MSIIIKYINNFPLQTKKHISYIRWLKLHKKVINKEHLTIEGIENIKSLIKSINK